MKVSVTFPDAERFTIDWLKPVLAGRGDVDGLTPRLSLAGDWAPTKPPVVLVAWDGTPIIDYPVRANATVRLTVYSNSPTTSKRLAALCQGLMVAGVGGPGVSSCQALTGVQVAFDSESKAHLASVTVRLILRPTPISA